MLRLLPYMPETTKQALELNQINFFIVQVNRSSQRAIAVGPMGQSRQFQRHGIQFGWIKRRQYS